MSLDSYAKDARTWRRWGEIYYRASKLLFANGDPFLLLPATTLGHHALEMYLKALLISEGMTVFNPDNVKKLDPALGLKATDCVWDHDLVNLAKTLAKKRTDFDVAAEFNVPSLLEMPMTLIKGFELFQPFFSELRYPMELQTLQELGEDAGRVLDALVAHLNPFLSKITEDEQ